MGRPREWVYSQGAAPKGKGHWGPGETWGLRHAGHRPAEGTPRLKKELIPRMTAGGASGVSLASPQPLRVLGSFFACGDNTHLSLMLIGFICLYQRKNIGLKVAFSDAEISFSLWHFAHFLVLFSDCLF